MLLTKEQQKYIDTEVGVHQHSIATLRKRQEEKQNEINKLEEQINAFESKIAVLKDIGKEKKIEKKGGK